MLKIAASITVAALFISCQPQRNNEAVTKDFAPMPTMAPMGSGFSSNTKPVVCTFKEWDKEEPNPSKEAPANEIPTFTVENWTSMSDAKLTSDKGGIAGAKSSMSMGMLSMDGSIASSSFQGTWNSAGSYGTVMVQFSGEKGQVLWGGVYKAKYTCAYK
jgi:hypothetical protein